MPLIMRLQEGHDFFVGDEEVRVKVREIISNTCVVLEVHANGGCRDIDLVTITDKCCQEILPEVRIQCGSDGTSKGVLLIFEAPKEIGIYRGNFMRHLRKRCESLTRKPDKPETRASVCRLVVSTIDAERITKTTNLGSYPLEGNETDVEILINDPAFIDYIKEKLLDKFTSRTEFVGVFMLVGRKGARKMVLDQLQTTKLMKL